MDRLEMLRTFVAVADHESFAEAARRLRISPTAASRAVAALEQSLGQPLFRRTTRSVRLTEHGALYLERCRAALETYCGSHRRRLVTELRKAWNPDLPIGMRVRPKRKFPDKNS